jgi:hypothetical protein
MKRTTSTIVLALLVATGAAGCGSENPAGPSFARSTPVAETARHTMVISPDPGSVEGDNWTDENGQPIQRPSGNSRKPKKPNPGQAYGHD